MDNAPQHGARIVTTGLQEVGVAHGKLSPLITPSPSDGAELNVALVDEGNAMPKTTSLDKGGA